MPADRIVVPKSRLRIIQHYALYLGQNHVGVDLIAENKIGFGVRLVTAADFFKDVIEFTRIEKFNGTNFYRKIAAQKAKQARASLSFDRLQLLTFRSRYSIQPQKCDKVDGLFKG